ncbi:MAG: hypothetical protein ACRDPR_11815, partial [Nocardioidaceae bacterium]
GSSGLSYIGLVSRSGGDGRAAFPEGWTAGGLDTSFFGGGGGAPVAVTTRAGGPEGTVALEAGQFGVISGEGPLVLDGELEVSAVASADGAVTGTIRNSTGLRLLEVALINGRNGTNVGKLDPGQEAIFEISSRRVDPFRPVEADVWPEQAGFDRPPTFDTIVNLALWTDAVRRAGPNFLMPGTVVAVGWTRSFQPGVEVSGPQAATGRSAIVSRTTITVSDGSLPAQAVRRELLRGPQGIRLDDGDVNGIPVQGTLFRFTVPAGTVDQPLELVIPEYLARVEVWDGTAWQSVDDHITDLQPNQFPDPMQTRAVAFPGSLLHEGTVFVRGTIRADMGGFDGTGFDLRGVQ